MLKRVGPILDKPALHVLVWKAGNIANVYLQSAFSGSTLNVSLGL